MPYKFLKDVAIADVAFEASGRTLKELFESAGLAVTNTMVRDLKKVRPKVTKTIKLRSDSLESLLFNFLQEIIFLKDAKQLLLSKFSVKIDEKKLLLAGKASGEKLDMEKHELTVDVKAVTYHNFELKKEKNRWVARVILDV
ncbi:MAG: archease [Candidatus Aenigmarchaeota archaeon]|nr:archease [Candidatus Aenigmarchaeota archaeon]